MTAKLDELSEMLLKEIGENHAEQKVENWINTGNPLLNFAISGRYDGGIPFGRIVEMAGESSTGKTASATTWLVEAQKMGGIGIFIDWERSFDVGLAENFGLNTKSPFWIYIKPKTWEEGNTKAIQACKIIRESGAIPENAPILIVADSVAAALPQSMVEKDITEYTMNDTTALARVTSNTLKLVASKAEEYRASFVYLNQIRLKPGVMFGDPKYTPGGGAMEFYSSARIFLGRNKITDKDKEFVGQKITAKVVKSKFTKPFKQCEMFMMYDEFEVAYYDHVASLLNYLIDKGYVEVSSKRVVWTDGKKYFASELIKHLNQQEDGLNQLKSILLEKVSSKD